MTESNARSAAIAEGEELASYRSLNTLAVLSFVLGLLSILAFAPSTFFVLVFPPAAIVFGVLALRQLAAAPEVWTGARMAKAGIGLAVLCAAASVVIKQITYARIGREGKVVADKFMQSLAAGDVEAAFWLKMPAEFRERMRKANPEEIPGQLAEQYSSFRSELGILGEAIARGEGTVKFEKVEAAYIEHGQEYAVILYNHHTDKEDSNVLVVTAASPLPEDGGRSWRVSDVKFGYVPDTYTPKSASGHGHSH